MSAMNNAAINLQVQQSAATRTLNECYPEHLHGRLTLLCYSENATYRVDTPAGKRYALRVHKHGYHDRTEIESELAWLRALEEHGVQVPQPIAGLDGCCVQQAICDTGQQLNVVLFHWVEGSEPTADVNASAFKRLGSITARLHQHSRKWKHPDNFRRIIWDHQSMVGSNGHWGDWRNVSTIDASHHGVISETLGQIEKSLSNYGKDATRYGLIHADLRLSNLLIDQAETRVIDFDDCGFGWYMHDLAAAVSFFEHHEKLDSWVENWLSGYESVTHLDAQDLLIIPTFIMQRRIQLLAWTGSHADTETVRGLPANWSDKTLELCKGYLSGDLIRI